MKRVFIDRGQGVVVKVFQNSKTLKTELKAAKKLSKFAVVPKMEILDSKVAQISLLDGFLGYQIEESTLNHLVADYLLSLEPATSTGLFPVHGDLQKQNIVIVNAKLGLIDFEHFKLAPLELELVNSLFFNDGNCLDIKSIARLLPDGFLSKKVMKQMVDFYSLKQVKQGMSSEEAVARQNRAKKIVDKLVFKSCNVSRKGLNLASSPCYT